ncbi:hypothetical protein CS063_14920 [Sporanaerobium hydrogeniformans]|uniref:Uncharacterized protein n=1 Tax=Sporanaerobium hydrogeniformans TaxID=3072179 RepID=A0AC61D893_9FIRM|nr:DUF3962 domain-containing protein [Sporanaerobium hydrogeniformans]PHV69600.1 hypothetical protein CS063_14920 [Sporanaerobium hydrogeniformans]
MKSKEAKKVMKTRALRDLKVLAWKVNPLQEPIMYYSVVFPKKWYDLLYGWYQKIHQRGDVKLPTSSLNGAMNALPVSLIEAKDFEKDKWDWLKLLRPVDPTIIFEVFKSWVAIEFINHNKVTEELKKEFRDGLSSFQLQDLEVVEETLDLREFNQFDNGTVDIPKMSYSMLPNYMMTYIAEEKIPIMIHGKAYYFLKASGRNVNELIAYPVQGLDGNYYSLGVSFKLITLPDSGYPVMKLITKVKRWANGKYIKKVSRKGNTTVFIKYNHKEERLADVGSTLGIEHLQYNRSKEQFIWCENTKEILENAKMVYLPEIENIFNESESYLTEDNRYTLLVTHNKDNSYDHSVQAGITMSEKNKIFNEISKLFDFIVPIEKDELRPIKCRLSKNILGKEKEKILTNYLKAASEQFTEINLEILWLREEVPDLFINWFKRSLENEDQVKWYNDDTTFEYNELRVNIRSKYSEGLTTKMTNYEEKVLSVKECLTDATGVVMTVVEILDKKNAEYTKGGDPKFAIRKGLYQCDRVNQFLNVNTKLSDAIIENVIRELFRQLGIYIALPQTTGLKGMPQKLDIVGFKLLSSNKNQYKDALEVPIAISTSTYDGQIMVKTPFSSGWISYYEAVLQLGKMKYQKYDKRKKNRDLSVDTLNRFFIEILNELKDMDALVIVDVSNRMNTLLPTFQNKNIIIQGTNTEYKKLRLIRVKANDENPEYVGEQDGVQEDFLTGVWGLTDNVFYSVEKKGLTFKKVNSKLPKLDYPRFVVKYPRMVEIVPVKLLEEDNKDEYVYFTHKMRGMNSMYEDYTKMPFVIHLGEKLQEVLEIK